jgi:hypothetical protein
MENWNLPKEDYVEFLPIEKAGKRVNLEFVNWVREKYKSKIATTQILLTPVLRYANSFRGYDRICSQVNKNLSDQQYRQKVTEIVENRENEAKQKAQEILNEFGGSPPNSIKENGMVEAFYNFFKFSRIYPAWKVKLMDDTIQSLKKFYIEDLISSSRNGKQLICECFSFSYMNGSQNFDFDAGLLTQLLNGFKNICQNK